MYVVLMIAGGVALILFGVRHLRKGLDRLFGSRMSRGLQHMTCSRWRALAMGLGISLAVPSSTTVSILTVQAVRSGHLGGRRTLAVMLGANIGLTLMVLLISLRLEQFAPVLILIGVVLFQGTERRTARGIGQVVLALGLIFMAVGLIKETASQFQPSHDLGQLLAIASNHPFWMAIVGALLTVLLQSATAAIALLIGLGASGVLNLPMVLAVVIGANLGTGLSMLLVGWTDHASRRLALQNLFAKGAVAVLLLSLLPVLAAWTGMIPAPLEHRIALAHTGFNVLVAMLFLPLVGPLDRLARLIVPERADAAVPFGPRYITDDRLDGFALATGQSMRELLRLSEIVRSMLQDMWRSLETQDEGLARDVQQRDDQVDLLDEQIKRFLAGVSAREGEQDDRGEVMRQLRYLTELETIGDVIDKNLAELAAKRARHRISFSQEGWDELVRFYNMVAENLLIAETAFATRDRELAEKLLRHKDHLGQLERLYGNRHFGRLKSGVPLTHESSAIHMDLLTHLKRINSSVTHVAYAIMA